MPPTSRAPAVTTAPAAAGTALAPLAAGSLAGRVVALDPGHDGGNATHLAQINQLVNAVTLTKACDTVGTQTDAGYPEHAFTWDLAVRLAGVLRAAGASVVLTRPDDSGWGPCITDRARIGNDAHAAVAISLHGDGGPPGGYGFQVIEPAPVGPNNAIVGASTAFGTDLARALRAVEPPATYIGTGGVWTSDQYGGLNLSTVPKVLLECGNMRNAADAGRMSSAAFRQQLAQAIGHGIATFLGAG